MLSMRWMPGATSVVVGLRLLHPLDDAILDAEKRLGNAFHDRARELGAHERVLVAVGHFANDAKTLLQMR